MIVAVVSIAYFIWNELKAEEPLLELRLFKNMNFLIICYMLLGNQDIFG